MEGNGAVYQFFAMSNGTETVSLAVPARLSTFGCLCRVFFALCCALPPAAAGAVWQFSVCNGRFGLIPVLLRTAGLRQIPSFAVITRSGLFELCYPAFLLNLCGFFLLVLSLHAKNHLVRKCSFSALALCAAAALAAAMWTLRFSFASTRDIFALRLFAPPTLRGYTAALGRYGMGTALLNSLLYALFAALCAVLLFAPVQKILRRVTPCVFTALSLFFVCGIPLLLLIFPAALRSLFTMPFFAQLTNTGTGRTLVYTLLLVPSPLFAVVCLSAGGKFPAAKSDCCAAGMRSPEVRILAPAVFIAVWNDFIVACSFAPSAKLQPVTQALFELVKKLRYAGNWPELFASLVLAVLPSCAAAAILIFNWRSYEK